MNFFTTLSLVYFLSISSVFAAGSAKSVQCKAQLARASEQATEVLPQNSTGFKEFTFEGPYASGKFTFSLNGKTEKIYALKLKFKLENSNWASTESPDLMGFVVDIELWDEKENKLLSAQKQKSDNVRTRTLLFNLLDKGKASLVTDTYSSKLREDLLKIKSEKVQEFIKKGDWIQATETALSSGDINPFEADFTSLFCTYQN